MLKVILAVENNTQIIGCDNVIPWYIKNDMQWFQKQTKDSVLIMGRKTFQSIGRVLHNRKMIVVSETSPCSPININNEEILPFGMNISYVSDNATHWVKTFEDAISMLNGTTRKIFVIGGATLNKYVFETCSHLIESMYITRVTTQLD